MIYSYDFLPLWKVHSSRFWTLTEFCALGFICFASVCAVVARGGLETEIAAEGTRFDDQGCTCSTTPSPRVDADAETGHGQQ